VAAGGAAAAAAQLKAEEAAASAAAATPATSTAAVDELADFFSDAPAAPSSPTVRPDFLPSPDKAQVLTPRQRSGTPLPTEPTAALGEAEAKPAEPGA
jgi:hypothetical protein